MNLHRWQRPKTLAKALGTSVEKLERAGKNSARIGDHLIERKDDKSKRFAAIGSTGYVYRVAREVSSRPEGLWIARWEGRVELWRGAWSELVGCWWHFEDSEDDALAAAKAAKARLES